ncbi:hypothetical protein LINPERHAP1_LOCUS26612 [Linum perenne]
MGWEWRTESTRLSFILQRFKWGTPTPGEALEGASLMCTFRYILQVLLLYL